MQATTLVESDFVSQDGDVILPRLSRLAQGDIERILSLEDGFECKLLLQAKETALQEKLDDPQALSPSTPSSPTRRFQCPTVMAPISDDPSNTLASNCPNSQIADQIAEAKKRLAKAEGLKQGNEEVLNMSPLIASQAVHPSKITEKEKPKRNLDEIEEIGPAGPDHGSKPATSSVYPVTAEQDFHASPENGSEDGAVQESEVHSNIQRAPTGQMHVRQTSRAHEIAQRLSSQVFTDRDEPLTTSVEHDDALPGSFTDTLEKALDFLAAALWRPPQGLIERGAQAPSAHHPLAISKAGPIFPERGLRVVLTAEYNLRKNNLLMTSRPNCCLEYAHQIRFSFGPHLNKTFKEVYENHPAYEAFCRNKRAQGPYMKEFLLYCNYCRGYIEVKPKVPNAGLAVRLGPPDSLTMRSQDPNVKPVELPLCPLHGTGSITDIGPESVSCRVLW
jgi:hypothetical protein